jgi:hypothetical protein
MYRMVQREPKGPSMASKDEPREHKASRIGDKTWDMPLAGSLSCIVCPLSLSLECIVRLCLIATPSCKL